jgi:hypothetical protein
MSRERGGYEREITRKIASAFADEAKKLGVTTIKDIFYKPAINPTICAVLSTSRQNPSAQNTPENLDLKKILTINKQITQRFKSDHPQDAPYTFQMLSEPDLESEAIDNFMLSNGFIKQPIAPQTV